MFKLIKSDYVGMCASFLCALHCLVTPFIFIVSSCTAICCSGTPLWWQAIDFFFLAVSLVAIIYASKCSSIIIKSLFWISWIALFVVIFNEQYLWFFYDARLKYVPALFLIVIHLYNAKFCNSCNTKK